MKHILVIGAGRSTSSLINYLLSHIEENNWFLTVADINKHLAIERIGNNQKNAKAIAFNVDDQIQRIHEINKADIVVSMLPAHMHLSVAKDCIALQKHLITASYVSSDMQALDESAKKNGVLLLNEMGVDPGIDHMSAKKVIHDIQGQGGKIKIFETFTGGLLAPESETNPWKYKFTWNPRNVVLAGSGGAVKFKQENNYKYIPYHKLFRRTELIEVEGYGKFEGYANRDSLKYRESYNLQEVPTIYRATLRRPGYCRAWNVFVQLGATDDSYEIENADQLTYRDFINLFLAYNPNDSVELKLMHYMKIDQDSDIMEKLEWLGIFEKTPIPFKKASPAKILQHILEQKWALAPGDRDMIVMYHKFGYELNGKEKMLESAMVIEGENSIETAMAKTVGLPVAIACKKVLLGELNLSGVHIPTIPEIYKPMLEELETLGVVFKEKEIAYQGY